MLSEWSNAVYRLGDGERCTSRRSVTIPCVLAGKVLVIKADVVDCTIPLLLSRHSMKKAGMVIDKQNDSISLFGKQSSWKQRQWDTTSCPSCFHILGGV